MSVYEQYLSDREYYEPLSRYFPASNYTYCTGSDGCVCRGCRSARLGTVIANQCDGSNDSDSVSSSEFSSGTRICVILGLCVSAVMIFTVFAVRRYIRPSNSGSAHRSPKGPQLSLTGWKSLREKLIETEHSFVKGDTTRLDSTTRSAEALAEAPEVTVEICSTTGPRQHTRQPVETQYMMAPM